VQTRARGNGAVFEFDPAPDVLVARHDLGDEIMLLHARLEFRVLPYRVFEELRRAEQNDRQFKAGERHGLLHIFLGRRLAGHIPFMRAAREYVILQ